MEQSRNPLCQAAHQRLEELMNPNSLQASDCSSMSHISADDMADILNENVPARPFDGDVFGTADNYYEDDYGQPQDDHADNFDNEAEELEHDIEAQLFELELEDSWEPNREPCMPEFSQTTVLDPEESDMESDGDQQHLQDVHLAQQHLAVKDCANLHPKVVHYSDQYPSSQAGFIVSSSGMTSDVAYTASVDGHNNLWAPFTSEINWKIARWAKLCGAGSTAFSDLLAIDGVCVSTPSRPPQGLTSSIRFTRRLGSPTRIATN
jgi:hypothetical protein